MPFKVIANESDLCSERPILDNAVNLAQSALLGFALSFLASLVVTIGLQRSARYTNLPGPTLKKLKTVL